MRLEEGRSNLKNNMIACEKSAKFLGIFLDQRLNFEEQVNYAIGSKANRMISIIKYICKISWGMKVNTVLLIYKRYARFIIEYGLPVYYLKL